MHAAAARASPGATRIRISGNKVKPSQCGSEKKLGCRSNKLEGRRMREKAREPRPSDSESLVLLLWAVCRVCVCVCVCRDGLFFPNGRNKNAFLFVFEKNACNIRSSWCLMP